MSQVFIHYAMLENEWDIIGTHGTLFSRETNCCFLPEEVVVIGSGVEVVETPGMGLSPQSTT